MELLEKIVTFMNTWLWDNNILLFLLCGTGIYFTIRLKFVQICKFGEGWKKLFGGFSLRGKKAGKHGMSSFQALTTAVAAQVGTGNIAGAATALAAGGPGAIFWMWVSAFFGMSTIYGEAVLAQTYKTTTADGQVTGGTIYYIKAAFKGKFGVFLAGFFSITIILALGFMGNMVQANSIGLSFENAFNIKPLYVGIACAVIAAFIFIGGVKRIASFTEKAVPIMAFLYMLGCIVILGMNGKACLDAFRQIFVGAFDPQAVAGGLIGLTVQKAMRYGVARGLFSNEAGMGSTPHAHALADVKDPHDQGVVAMMGVFFDTFIILTLTALVVISSGMLGTIDPATGEAATASVLAQMAFNKTFGSFGNIFIAVCMLFFAFSTIVGWYFFGETNVRALLGNVAVKVYAFIVMGCIIVGSTLRVDLVWNMSDMFNGLMVIPNLLALLVLSGVVAKYANSKERLSSR